MDAMTVDDPSQLLSNRIYVTRSQNGGPAQLIMGAHNNIETQDAATVNTITEMLGLQLMSQPGDIHFGQCVIATLPTILALPVECLSAKQAIVHGKRIVYAAWPGAFLEDETQPSQLVQIGLDDALVTALVSIGVTLPEDILTAFADAVTAAKETKLLNHLLTLRATVAQLITHVPGHTAAERTTLIANANRHDADPNKLQSAEFLRRNAQRVLAKFHYQFARLLDQEEMYGRLPMTNLPTPFILNIMNALQEQYAILFILRDIVDTWALTGDGRGRELKIKLEDASLCETIMQLLQSQPDAFQCGVLEYMVGIFPIGDAAMRLIHQFFVAGTDHSAIALQDFTRNLSFGHNGTLDFSALHDLTPLLTKVEQSGADVDFHSLTRALLAALQKVKTIDFEYDGVNFRNTVGGILKADASYTTSHPYSNADFRGMIAKLILVNDALLDYKYTFFGSSASPSSSTVMSAHAEAFNSPQQGMVSAGLTAAEEQLCVYLAGSAWRTQCATKTCPKCAQLNNVLFVYCSRPDCHAIDYINTWMCSRCNLANSIHEPNGELNPRKECRYKHGGCLGKLDDVGTRVGDPTVVAKKPSKAFTEADKLALTALVQNNQKPVGGGKGGRRGGRGGGSGGGGGGGGHGGRSTS